MARRKKVSIDNLFVFGFMGLVVFLSNQAKSYVLDKPIEIINGEKLVRLIEEVTKDEQANKQLDAMLTQFNG